jgi:hypothetical protein
MESLNNPLNIVNTNKMIGTILTMFLVLYAAMAAPKLPVSVAKLLDNNLVKVGFLFLMAFLISKNPTIAIISAVALFVTIQTLSSYETVNSAVVKVQENFCPTCATVDFDNNMQVPLSPKRSEMVNECARMMQQYKLNADQAILQGNHELAMSMNLEAAKQEVKMNSAIKAKQHMMVAENAEQNGDLKLAETHKTEANKQELKIAVIVNAEEAKNAVVLAEQEGNHEEAQVLAEVAKVEEEKANLIAQTEVKLTEAKTAQENGNLDQALQLSSQANKMGEQVALLVNDESVYQVIGVAPHDLYAEVEFKNSDNNNNNNNNQGQILGQTNCNNMDFDAYESGEFAQY